MSSYNANPPPDDGSQVANNIVAWSTFKTKLPDPIKSAFDTSETNTNTAFSKVVGGGGFTSTATNYTVLAADQGKFVKVTASATITTPDATVVGSPFVFAVVNEYTADITLAGNNPGVQQNIDGVASITIPSGAGVFLNTDGTNWFTAGQNFSKTAITPKGRLTLASGTPVMAVDQTGKTAVYYTPYEGDLIPIPNGTTLSVKEFSELTLTLVSNHVADSIYDVFVFLDPADGSTVRVGTGPAWSSITAGSCARGTGAGTTELVRLKGVFVNNVAATMRNGSSTYSVALKCAIYVGTIYIDHTAGQVSCHVTWGQNRKWGVWNAFNRVPVNLLVGDSTASWQYTTNTVRASNNVPTSYSGTEFNVGSGTTCNGLVLLDGLAEESYDIKFKQYMTGTSGNTFTIGVGLNSTTAITGLNGSYASSATSMNTAILTSSELILPPKLGINNICALENCPATAANAYLYGTNADMQLSASWRA